MTSPKALFTNPKPATTKPKIAAGPIDASATPAKPAIACTIMPIAETPMLPTESIVPPNPPTSPDKLLNTLANPPKDVDAAPPMPITAGMIDDNPPCNNVIAFIAIGRAAGNANKANEPCKPTSLKRLTTPGTVL